MNSNWAYSLEMLNSDKNWQFVSRVTLKFNGWLWYATSSFVHRFVDICEFKLELQSGSAQAEVYLFWPLWPRPLTLIFRRDIPFIYGNDSWKF